MIRHLIVILLVLFVCHANAQNSYISQSGDTLQKWMKAAVAVSDYDKAGEIKKELSSREAEEKHLISMQAELKEKVKAEDFGAASSLDKQIKELKSRIERKEQLRLLIQAALKKQDYAGAKTYKDELISLYPKEQSSPAQSNVNVENDKKTPVKQMPGFGFSPNTANTSISSSTPVNPVKPKFKGVFYNYITDIPYGIKIAAEDGLVYSFAYGYNELASTIFRSSMGFRTNSGIYAEAGVLTYMIDEAIDPSKSEDFNFAFDWEVGYMEKLGPVGILIGIHMVQLSSVQLSFGIGF